MTGLLSRVTGALPSWRLSLTALGVGLGMSYTTFELERYSARTGRSAESMLWRLIEYCGWYWWSIPIMCSFVGLYYMAQLSAPRTRSGIASRILIYVAFTCYAFSWGNNALGPVAAVTLIVGLVIFLRQVVVIDIRVRKEADPAHMYRPLGERILRALVAADSSPKTL